MLDLVNTAQGTVSTTTFSLNYNSQVALGLTNWQFAIFGNTVQYFLAENIAMAFFRHLFSKSSSPVDQIE